MLISNNAHYNQLKVKNSILLSCQLKREKKHEHKLNPINNKQTNKKSTKRI